MQMNQQDTSMIINNPMAMLTAACVPNSGAMTNPMRGRVHIHMVKVNPIVSIPGKNLLMVCMALRSYFLLHERLL